MMINIFGEGFINFIKRKFIMVLLTTANGDTELVPVFCEVTGKQLCWKTIVPQDYDPAIVSFEVVNIEGKIIEDCINITTF